MRPIGHAREPHTPHPYDPEAGLLPKAAGPLQPGDETAGVQSEPQARPLGLHLFRRTPRSRVGLGKIHDFPYSPADSITPATIDTSMCPFWSIAPW